MLSFYTQMLHTIQHCDIAQPVGAFRRRDWLQEYANANCLQKFLQTITSF